MTNLHNFLTNIINLFWKINFHDKNTKKFFKKQKV